MKTKLTLQLNKQVLDRAKEYAHNHDISLSFLIESYLELLTSEKTTKSAEISPLIKSLSGVIQFDKDFDVKKYYTKFLHDKYEMINMQSILRALKKKLEDVYSDSIVSVILFGSQATNTAREDSDYDILILLKNEYSSKDETNILDICYDIDLEYNILIDAHILSIEELSTLRGKQPIFVNALKNGIYA